MIFGQLPGTSKITIMIYAEYINSESMTSCILEHIMLVIALLEYVDLHLCSVNNNYYLIAQNNH